MHFVQIFSRLSRYHMVRETIKIAKLSNASRTRPSPVPPLARVRSPEWSRMITSMKYHFVTELGRDTFLAHAKLHLDLESYTTHLPGAATGEPLRAISVYFRANLFAKSRRRAATDESASSVSAPHLMNMVTRPLPTCVVIRRDPLRDDRRIPPRQRSEPCPHLYLMTPDDA